MEIFDMFVPSTKIQKAISHEPKNIAVKEWYHLIENQSLILIFKEIWGI